MIVLLAMSALAASCQEMSNTYGIFHGKTFGSAGNVVQNAWRGQSCATSPASTARPALCQSFSDGYFIVHGKSWGSAPEPVQKSWTLLGCSTVPRVVNIARGKAARQSSTWYDAVASRAIDGNANGAWAAGSMTYSDGTPPWLEVDLGASYDFGEVRVYNRTDSCCTELLDGASVGAQPSPCDVETGAATALPLDGVHVGARTVVSLAGKSGRYLCVRGGTRTTLMVAEIEALGSLSPPPPPPPATPPPAPPTALLHVAVLLDPSVSRSLGPTARARAADAVKRASVLLAPAGVTLQTGGVASWPTSPIVDDTTASSPRLAGLRTWATSNGAALTKVAGSKPDFVLMLTGGAPDADAYATSDCTAGIGLVSVPSLISADGIAWLVARSVALGAGARKDEAPSHLLQPAIGSDRVGWPSTWSTLATTAFLNFRAARASCVAPKPLTWTDAPKCGDGVITEAEACDPGPGATDGCCTSSCGLAAGCSCANSQGCCANGKIAASGTVCRAATSACDRAETCDGRLASCDDAWLAPGATVGADPDVGICLDGTAYRGSAVCSALPGTNGKWSLTSCASLSCDLASGGWLTVQDTDGIACGAGSQCRSGACVPSSSLTAFP